MAQLGKWKSNLLLLTIMFVLFSCENENSQKENKKNITQKEIVKVNIQRPDFNADSAYHFIQQQVDFGPRFPNNEAHGKCADFLKNKLSSYGLQSNIQIGKAKTFNNKDITIKNIIGEYNPEAKKRILLFAHWDSRPFADQDTKDMTKPILGANDGASGVGVLLEVARQLNILKPAIGIDIIFFDAEDYGQPSSAMSLMDSDSWCLGSQYWTKNLHKPNYKADFGILLDMVGSENAVFTRESISMRYAPHIVDKVWNVAAKLGYSNHFTNELTYFVGTDDHKYVNEIAKIPSIDIIHYERSSGNFHHSWHTHNDNMSIISKPTLSAVGETLIAVIIAENK
ncbi:MAG: M28 family peptidase [Flavobacteriales bacterium]|nr:MAG: M28 family peptidase [Flavobacteriales bacterium]